MCFKFYGLLSIGNNMKFKKAWIFSPTLLLGTPLGTPPDPLEAERGESSGEPVPTELGRLSGIQPRPQITNICHIDASNTCVLEGSEVRLASRDQAGTGRWAGACLTTKIRQQTRFQRGLKIKNSRFEELGGRLLRQSFEFNVGQSPCQRRCFGRLI